MPYHPNFAPVRITQLHVLPRKLCPCAHHSAAFLSCPCAHRSAACLTTHTLPLRTSLSCMSYRANFAPVRITQLHVLPRKLCPYAHHSAAFLLCPCAHHSAACLTAQTLSLRASLSCMSHRTNFVPARITQLHVLPRKLCPCAHHSAACLTAQTLPLCTSLCCMSYHTNVVPAHITQLHSYRANFVPARIAQLHVLPHKLCPCAHHTGR